MVKVEVEVRIRLPPILKLLPFRSHTDTATASIPDIAD